MVHITKFTPLVNFAQRHDEPRAFRRSTRRDPSEAASQKQVGRPCKQRHLAAEANADP